jgi:hypothetical protein
MEPKFLLLAGIVQVTLDHGEKPEEIVPVLSEAAILARTNQLQHLLVISGVGDPATPESVSRALDSMHALGAPPPLKIAFVACTFPQYSVYHFSETYAPRLGIAAKVLASFRDAQDWLALREGWATQPQGYARRVVPAALQDGVEKASAPRQAGGPSQAAGGPFPSSPPRSIRSSVLRERGGR